MKNNPLKTNVKVVHSKTKSAWNIIGTKLGCKYKIARIPYLVLEQGENMEKINTKEKAEALEIAQYLANALNNHKQL